MSKQDAGASLDQAHLAGAARAGATRATVLFFTYAVMLWAVVFLLLAALGSVFSGLVRVWTFLVLRVVVGGYIGTVGWTLTLDTSVWGKRAADQLRAATASPMHSMQQK